LLVVSLLGLVIPTAGWLALSFQMMLGVALLVLLRQVWKRPLGFEFKIAVSMVALTLLVTSLYQGLNPLAIILGLPGLPVSTELLFNAGELLVLVSVLALWWSIARKAQASIWLIAALPALLFAVPRLLSPAMTGIMTIWSTGLTLFLPWPVYVVALWLAGVTVLYAPQQGDLAGWAIIMLLAGGFAPQLSIQAFLGLIALWLLVNAAGPREHDVLLEAAYSAKPLSAINSKIPTSA
jgi:hypothetical protein